MIVGNKSLSDDDYLQLAELHLANLERSIISQLGKPLLCRYYIFIAQSSEDFLFVNGDSGALRGVAVLSLDSDTVMPRFAKTYWLAFLIALVRKTLGQPSFASSFIKSAGSSNPATENIEQIPEIIQLFVDVKYRGQGIGGNILETVDRFLEKRDIPQYFIRTRVEDNEATLGFYARNRFNEILRADWKGVEFVFMSRNTAH